MADVAKKTPNKRKSFPAKFGSGKKQKLDNQTPQKVETPQEVNVNSIKKSGKKNKKQNNFKSSSPKKVLPFPGVDGLKVERTDDGAIGKKQKGGTKPETENIEGKTKRKRKSNFYTKLDHLRREGDTSENVKLASSIEEKIKTIQERGESGELTKSSRRKLNVLLNFKAFIEGKPVVKPQNKAVQKNQTPKQAQQKKPVNGKEQIATANKQKNAKQPKVVAGPPAKKSKVAVEENSDDDEDEDESDDEEEEGGDDSKEGSEEASGEEEEDSGEGEEEEDDDDENQEGEEDSGEEEEDEESEEEVQPPPKKLLKKAVEEDSDEDEDESDEEGNNSKEGSEESSGEEEDEESEKVQPPPKEKTKQKQHSKTTDVNLEDLKKSDIVTKQQKRYVLFVGNIPFDTVKKDLIEHFQKCGEIKHIRIPTEKGSNRPRGFAYVEVSDADVYQKCLSMHHTFLKSRRINVLYTTGGKKKGDDKKKDIKAKNLKLHAMRKQGQLLGSKKESQKRSFRRKKQKLNKSQASD